MSYSYPHLDTDSDIELGDAEIQDCETYYSGNEAMSELEDQMMAKMDKMMAMMASMAGRMESQEKELRSQASVIKKQAETIETLQARNDVDKKDELRNEKMDIDQPSNLVHHRPHHRTSDLKQFNGDRSEWVSWRTEAHTKLRIDGVAIGDSLDQFGYLYMHMSATAQKRIQQWYNLRLKLGTDCTPAAFLERAEATFGDPNEEKNALTLLGTLKQKQSESFSDFITKFEEVLAQAGGEGWPMKLQVDALEKALNREMQSRMVSYPLPDPSYNTYRGACLTIDAKLQAMKAWDSRSSSSNALNKANNKEAGSSRGNGRSVAGQRALWVSGEERERRRQAGLCLRCGSSNHIVKGCKFRPAENPNSDEKLVVNALHGPSEIENHPERLAIEAASWEQGNV